MYASKVAVGFSAPKTSGGGNETEIYRSSNEYVHTRAFERWPFNFF
jgi:hypothetical protein